MVDAGVAYLHASERLLRETEGSDRVLVEELLWTALEERGRTHEAS